MAILRQQQRPRLRLKQQKTEPIICKMKDTPRGVSFVVICGRGTYVRTRVNLRQNTMGRPQRTQFCTYFNVNQNLILFQKCGIIKERIIYIKKIYHKREGQALSFVLVRHTRLAAAARFCSLIVSSRAILRAFSSAAFAALVALVAFSSTLRAQSAAISYPS